MLWNEAAFVTKLLRVAKQGHEARVHVVLLMAVEERVAGVVGDQVGFHYSSRFNNHHIFLDAAGRGAAN